MHAALMKGLGALKKKERKGTQFHSKIFCLPQDFEKMLPKFDPNEMILVDDHL